MVTGKVTVETLQRLADAFNTHDLDAVMSFYGDDRHWVSDDRGCSEWLLTGTTTQGELVEVRGCDLFEFRDGKIARKDSYWKLVERA
jgi:hypothetical protein